MPNGFMLPGGGGGHNMTLLWKRVSNNEGMGEIELDLKNYSAVVVYLSCTYFSGSYAPCVILPLDGLSVYVGHSATTVNGITLSANKEGVTFTTGSYGSWYITAIYGLK